MHRIRKSRWVFTLSRRYAVALSMIAALLAVGSLVAYGTLVRSAPVHAATSHRLETAVNNGGTIQHRWSDDGGATWSAWASLPNPPNDTFDSAPAIVSDGVARLTVVALDHAGILLTNTYNNGPWSGWSRVPTNTCFLGQTQPNQTCIPYDIIGFTNYYFASPPALTSWGPGRMELFINGLDSGTGDTVLLHTWSDNYTWSGNWETLGGSLTTAQTTPGGTIVRSGSWGPTAVSWGPGRDDVFEILINTHLLHMWFDNGSWSSDWEDLGTPPSPVTISARPAVTSSGPGRLNVFAQGSDGHLWGTWFAGGWGGWGDVGCCLAGDVTDSVAAVSQAPLTVDVFVVGTQHDLYRKANTNGTWADWQFLDHSLDFTNIAATVWVPFAPDPPTDTPIPRCRVRPCQTTP
jgi:hypothetical protein